MRGRGDEKIITCVGCSEPFPESELNDDGFCEGCAEEFDDEGEIAS